MFVGVFSRTTLALARRSLSVGFSQSSEAFGGSFFVGLLLWNRTEESEQVTGERSRNSHSLCCGTTPRSVQFSLLRAGEQPPGIWICRAQREKHADVP